MSEIFLSEVMDDGVLAEPYTIQRSTGNFVQGGFQISSVNIDGYGVVSVASEQDLQMIPEGDQVTGAMVFHSSKRIYETQIDSPQGSVQWFSDVITWNHQPYKVLKVSPYPNRGYWRAIAVRTAGV